VRVSAILYEMIPTGTDSGSPVALDASLSRSGAAEIVRVESAGTITTKRLDQVANVFPAHEP
jgi:hypothetical protein